MPLAQHRKITQKILTSALQVWNTLGYGFLQEVYENALATELRENSLEVHQRVDLHVRYKQTIVGSYLADLLVENKVLVLVRTHAEQKPNYETLLHNALTSTDLHVGLLLIFSEGTFHHKRLVLQP
ncbi:MAG: GxxExxY protein [bacterium]|nr:GxxExxY protein [bacterium]